MVAEIPEMTAADFRDEALRCGAALQSRGAEVTQIGKDLAERGKKLAQPLPTPQ